MKTPVRRMSAIVALALSLLSMSSASAQVWGDIRSDLQGQARREVYVGQFFRDQDINLISLLRLNQYNLQGSQVEAVEVVLQDNGRASLTLMANGYVQDQENFLSTYTTLRPLQYLEIGPGLRSLNLRVRSKLYIERIAVVLGEQYNPGYPGQPEYPGQPGYPGYPDQPGNPGQDQIVLQGQVNQNILQGSIDIARITGLMNYRGYQITEVMVNGRSINQNFSRARLLINGTIDGEALLNPQGGRFPIYPRSTYIVGRNLNSINLLLEGAYIANVEVRLRRF